MIEIAGYTLYYFYSLISYKNPDMIQGFQMNYRASNKNSVIACSVYSPETLSIAQACFKAASAPRDLKRIKKKEIVPLLNPALSILDNSEKLMTLISYPNHFPTKYFINIS